MATNPMGIQDDTITTSNIDTEDINTHNIPDTVVIHPDDRQHSIDSDSDAEQEYSDALDNNDNSCIRDELTDIKNRKFNDYNSPGLVGSESDHLHADDDEEFFNDAQDHEDLENELHETESKDTKEEEIERRQEAEGRLTDEIKEERRQKSIDMKKSANELYVKSQHREAISIYSDALDLCPLCYKVDRAILFANRAAAKLKLDDKDGAVEDCGEAIDINPNYLKAILRRAQIFEDTDRPHESMKDFERVLELDPRHIESIVAVRRLPDKIKEKDEKIKAEMMDNLKKLGNMCLNPFGLSTENFQFEQDPNTGGYSVNFKK